MRSVLLLTLLVTAACGDDEAGSDAIDADLGVSVDAAAPDARLAPDAMPESDAMPEPDSMAMMRTTLVPGFCPSTVTVPGLYEGTLAQNLNDISGCDGLLSAPGRDGAVRLELAVGATVTATMRHDGDGRLYILDACPVTASCLDASNVTVSGSEEVSYTNNGGETNTVYVVLDSDAVDGPQTFELDLMVQ